MRLVIDPAPFPLLAGYRVGLTNASGATRIWPKAFGTMMPTDRFDVTT